MIESAKKKKSNFPADQKKFATLKILKGIEGRRSNINQLLHTVGLTKAQRTNYRLILRQMEKDGWILVEQSTEQTGTKIVSLTEKGSKIDDSVKQLLNSHPELTKETKVFRISNDDESTDYIPADD
tara:strand:- start:165 stop:542 length:378 start_codon:yes stop_codon:yes gene_type:complete